MAANFPAQFKKLTGHTPLSWQSRLFKQLFLRGKLPSAIDIPTGLGKTSVMVLWYLARKAGAPLPRRLVYVVDRRAVVDQATDEAEKIKKYDNDLHVSTLRGKLADNRKWLEDPASPAIIVGTVDMIGSRLLFEGYGVSRKMRPYHAGLLGVDTLLVLDESHLVPPFERLLEQIARTSESDFAPKEDTDHNLIPRFHLLPLSATRASKNQDKCTFRLEELDEKDAIVKKRLHAKKRLTLESTDEKTDKESGNTLGVKLANKAWKLAEQGKKPVRILVRCSNQASAEDAKEEIKKLAKEEQVAIKDINLMIYRTQERNEASRQPKDLGFSPGSTAPEKSTFVITNSARITVHTNPKTDHIVIDEEKLEIKLANEAWRLAEKAEKPVRVLVYCNSRATAAKTTEAIEKKLPKKGAASNEDTNVVMLLVGERRVKEREEAKIQLEQLGFFSGNKAPKRSTFVIATSAGEVGIDLDADHMVMDVVPFERMIQRLGRVNRLGTKRDARIIVVYEDIDKEVTKKNQSKKNEQENEQKLDKIYRKESTLKCLQKLPEHTGGVYDASPLALVKLREDYPSEVEKSSTPEPLYPALTRPLVDAWSMTSLQQHTGRPEPRPWLRGWVENEPQTTLVWRRFLPVRVKGGEADMREVMDFFEAASPHLTETLDISTEQVSKWLSKLGKDFDKKKNQNEYMEDNDTYQPASLSEQKIVAITLSYSKEDVELLKLAQLSELSKGALEQRIEDRTLILDARIGGLSKDGLFDPDSKEQTIASTSDTDSDWEKEIGFRVRIVAPEDVENPDEDNQWHETYSFDLQRDHEGNPERQLRVEKYKATAVTEESRSLSPGDKQSLEDHQKWTADKARELAEKLELREDIAGAIEIAARLHDEGKRARNWQRAFSAETDGVVYAKTTGPFRRGILGGYRHEFGSLPYVEKDHEYNALPNDMKDLVLHLVAAHHGRARPTIETNGCEDAPPSLLEARAREVALRFARLQKRFGPWGLAWLETLVRAADQQASRKLDKDINSDG